MHGKMAISAYIFEKSRKGPIFKASKSELRILSVDGFSRFHLKYTCTKISQEMTQIVEVFFGEDEILLKL